MRGLGRTITTLLVAVCLASCSGEEPGSTEPWPSPSPSSPSSSSPSSSSPPERRLVAVVGQHRTEAIDLLASLGVVPEIETRAGCARDIVVAQRPVPRQVTRSERVTIVVETGGGRRACDLRPARNQARALLDWALKEGPPPSFADDVEYLLGNQTVYRRLATPLNRLSWELCEHGEGCDSPLTVLAAMARPAVVRVMTGPCPDSYVLLRRGLASTLGRSVTVVDQRARSSCDDVFAVQVWVDDQGRISAVNWVL